MDAAFGEALRAARQERGLTQEQLAERVGTLESKRISDYECGRIEPRVTKIRQLAEALGCSAAMLMEERRE